MTILDACVTVLNEANEPLTIDKIYDQIISKNLYKFGAKDPKNMVSSTLRKHLKSDGKKRIILVSKGLYKISI